LRSVATCTSISMANLACESPVAWRISFTVATNKGSRWFFVFGFEKNERDNIEDDELQALKDYAADWLKRTSTQLDNAVADGTLQEICQ
jgi:hypothetical protein